MRVPHLPTTGEDINIISQTYALGGCAFNASWLCHLLHVDYLLFSPVGTGIYGDFVKAQMNAYQLPPTTLEHTDANGCCCCLIDEEGERTFLSYHGAEYQFKQEWFHLLEAHDIDYVYVCGLEIEEESGIHIIEYLERHPNLTIYFATGPRIEHIPIENIKRIFALHPILHLNIEEAYQYSQCTTLQSAAQYLYEQVNNTIIITLGRDGCAYYDGSLHIIKTQHAKQVDTTGAGDCHIGSIIAYLSLGYTLDDAITLANRNAGMVVSKQGAILSLEEFETLV